MGSNLRNTGTCMKEYNHYYSLVCWGKFPCCTIYRLDLLTISLGEYVFGCILVHCFVMDYVLQFEKITLYERVQSVLLLFGLVLYI